MAGRSGPPGASGRVLPDPASDGVVSALARSVAGGRCYFASKNAVLAALVERTVTALRAEIHAADATGESAAALRRSLDQTRDMWREHGSVMRAAVELAPMIPAVGDSWHGAVAVIRDITRTITERAGLPGDDGPTGAHAITTALVWMTERAFYPASKSGPSLDDTARTLTHLWLTALEPAAGR